MTEAPGPVPNTMAFLLADAHVAGLPWRRFLSVFAAAVLLTAGLFASISVTANPRGEFPVHVIPPTPENEAAYKRYLLERLDAPPQVLVYGSSRMQKIDPDEVEALANRTTFNYSLAGSKPDTFLDLHRNLARLGVVPDEIVVGVDLQWLQPAPQEPLATRFAFGPLRQPGPSLGDWRNGLEHTLSPLHAKEVAIGIARAVGVPVPTDITFEPDGLIHYVPWEAARAEGAFDANASLDAFLGRIEPGFPPFAGLDAGQTGALRDLVQETRAEGIQVRLVVTPVHPRLEESYGPGGYAAAREASLGFLQGLCAPGVQVFDYSRLPAWGGRPEWFYDGAHYMEENASLLVQALYRGDGQSCPP